MKVRKELGYADDPNSSLDEALDLIRTVINLQAELLEAYSLLESSRMEEEEKALNVKSPSLFMAILTPFSREKAVEYFKGLTVTSFRNLALKVLALGALFSVVSPILVKEKRLALGSALTILGDKIASILLAQAPNLDFPIRIAVSMFLGVLLMIVQSTIVGTIVGFLNARKGLSSLEGAKIVITADFVHVALLVVLGAPFLQFQPYLTELSPLASPILALIAIISPLVLKFVTLWRGIETIYGYTGLRASVSVLFLFILNLIYYMLIMG